MLLPPNVTAVLQPMDQNPIRLVKLEYRAKLLWNIVAQENIPVENILKGHSIRDAILLLKLTWDELPRAVLIKAWKNIKQWDDDQYDSEDEIPLLTLIRSNRSHDDTLREVQSLLSKVGGVDVSSEDIENWNDDQNTEDDEDFEVSDNEDEEPVVEEDMQQQKVSFSEAVDCINTLIKWYENNNDANQISHLINMRTKIVRSYYTKEKKQTSLDRFFKPALTN
ncbi:jerky protein homolog-like [Bactrocera dorsalis]|uniref:Jerky protein homolog-like n=1 Tax=Bactrocera dorsalis TaxID=27457 RepID=A0ABM3IYS6_BACDO|nr:jerky protein homolog-like [Bactrocera dorsalis]